MTPQDRATAGLCHQRIPPGATNAIFRNGEWKKKRARLLDSVLLLVIFNLNTISRNILSSKVQNLCLEVGGVYSLRLACTDR